MPHFTVIQLDETRLAGALALVRLAAPGLGPEDWQLFAASLEGDGGILGAVSPDGSLHGVAAYRRDRDLLHGPALRADPFVTCELSPAAPVRSALLAALEALARAQGCAALVLALSCRGDGRPESLKAGGWTTLGFQSRSVSIVRPLSAASVASPPRTALG